MKQVVVGILYKVVDNQKLYLLLSETEDFGNFTGLLYPSGGRINAGETESVALVREIQEELGITAVPIKKLHESPGDVPDQITYWWLCAQLPEDIKIKMDEVDVKEVKWLTKEEILNNPHILWPATYKFFMQVLFTIN